MDAQPTHLHTPIAVGREALHKLTEQVIADIRKHGIYSLFEELAGYHDFRKSRLKPGLLEKYLSPLGVTSKDVQIEFAAVLMDLQHQVHIHREAYAVATPLGLGEELPSPRNAYYYLSTQGEDWLPLAAGNKLDVPPGTKHGFALEPDGICYFLTIQSPPTDRHDFDDFEKVKGPTFAKVSNKFA